MCPNPQFPADFVTFTGEILNGKLHFLSSYVADYLQNIRDREVLPNVQPGYLQSLMPNCAPEEPDSFYNLMEDIDKLIMPGTTHWMHPTFNVYIVTGGGTPSMLADANPANTELEMIMMDWIAKLIKLPEYSLFSSKGKGGGVIQGSASETTLVSILANRSTFTPENINFEKLVAYTSNQCHGSVVRAAMIAGAKKKKEDN